MIKIEQAPVVGKTVNRLYLLLIIFFLVSGLCGLVYQVLWSRLLGLVFGVTVYAVSATLASFMSGLAIGSYLAGRFADRLKNPLLWYGIVEIFVGLTALATPWGLQRIENLYANLYPAIADSFALLTLLRFTLAFLVLMLPTVLMGTTLPLIIKSSLLKAHRLGESIGVLYATNTAGAIAGTLLTGFYLIGNFGMMASFQFAAALNLLVGIAAIVVASKYMPPVSLPIAEEASDVRLPTHQAEESALVVSKPAQRLILVMFTLSGFISFALEVIWVRVLSLSSGGSIYAFTIMLTAFLSGIALGSYLITPFFRRPWNWLATLAILEIATAIVSLLSLLLLAKLYPVMTRDESWMQVAAFASILPTTTLLGMAFPVGLRLYSAGASSVKDEIGKRIGRFYSLNVFGSIVGSIVGGFLLLPRLGSRYSFIVLAALNLAGGLALLAWLPKPKAIFKLLVAALSILLLALVAYRLPNLSETALKQRYSGNLLLTQEEGMQTTVSVQQDARGRRTLYLDGRHQANDSRRMVRIHSRIGHLAMLLHNQPQEALVIGLGGGVTAGAVSSHTYAKVDIVELSDTVIRGSEWFRHVNLDVLHRPNVRLRVDDGRNYLRLTDKRYDVLTADIIPPGQAGAGNLYAAEYFKLCANALKEDGLMLQWIQDKSEEEYKLIMRTFLSVFPHSTLWAKGTLIVGAKKPLQLDRAAFERRLQDATLQQHLEQIGITDFASLCALYTTDAAGMQAFLGNDSLILTDDRPLTEYFLSLKNNGQPADTSKLKGDVTKYLKP